ncbi:MAG: hypothetical protein SGI91_00455 [Alphaproteobacteria bacterium]|nr:hypothetical protein [Alphaproteobacteria bacterium]
MRFALTMLFFVLAAPAWAEAVAVDSPRWQFEGAPPQVVEFQGKRALSLVGTNARLADADFDAGVIEFDMALPNTKQSFPGVIFRGQDDGNYEHFYLRPHQNGNPDSMQYTPVINGMTAWQIYKQYNAQTIFPVNQWMRVRLEIGEDSARVFVNSDKPTLVVHDLKRERKAGFVMIKGSLGGAYFANINITPGAQDAAPAEPVSELMPGHVRAWFVSSPMAEAVALAAAGANTLKGLAWTRLPVESNGIANLARAAAWTEKAPTVLTRVVVRADRARSVAMRFGFSDRVRVYVNGALLFTGDDSQASRDYRFLGTVGLYDELQLQLRRGDNDVVFAVSEGGGGWAAQAAFIEMDGLTLVDAQ